MSKRKGMKKTASWFLKHLFEAYHVILLAILDEWSWAVAVSRQKVTDQSLPSTAASLRWGLLETTSLWTATGSNK